tara:strand:- start:67 stop:810 length:744 start_codon:yes stop_codon:yes gene_type:complete
MNSNTRNYKVTKKNLAHRAHIKQNFNQILKRSRQLYIDYNNYSKFNIDYKSLVKFYLNDLNSILDKKFVNKNLIHSYDMYSYVYLLLKPTNRTSNKTLTGGFLNVTDSLMNVKIVGQTSDSFSSCSESLTSSLDSCSPPNNFFSLPDIFSNFKLPTTTSVPKITQTPQCGGGIYSTKPLPRFIKRFLDTKLNLSDRELQFGEDMGISEYCRQTVSSISSREFTQQALLKLNNFIDNQLIIKYYYKGY